MPVSSVGYGNRPKILPLPLDAERYGLRSRTLYLTGGAKNVGRGDFSRPNGRLKPSLPNERTGPGKNAKGGIPVKKWSIDPDHAVARFSVRHFMIASVEGLFTNVTGVIQVDPPDLTQLSVEAEIEVRSLTTGHRERDEHLLSADYFDAEKYPKISFKSTRVEVAGGNHGKITGDLTIRGIRKPITLDFDFFGPVKSPFTGITCVGFSATGQVKREDYGMITNIPMEGGVVVGKDVQIHMEVEADLVP
jgi:polyisoprenoid-binding protein YceI